MPVTIKTANMKYKNSNGEYVGVNAVSDNTTAQQLALIQNKGTEVKASIPLDYTALTTKVGNVEGMIAPEFSISTAYSVGDLVEYNDHYYRFTSDHAEGAWNASHVVQTTVSGEMVEALGDLNSKLNDIDTSLSLYEYVNVPLTWTANYTWDKRYTSASPVAASGLACANAITVLEGENYLLKDAYVSGNNYKVAYIIYNDDYSTVIETANAESSSGFYNYSITIPANGKHLCINCNSGTESTRLRASLQRIIKFYPSMETVIATVNNSSSTIIELTDTTENLFIPQITELTTISGVTITPINKSTIKLNGTASGNFNIFCGSLPAGTYYFYSNDLISGKLNLRYGSNIKVWPTETSVTFENSTDINLRVSSGAELDNYVFSAMISETEHHKSYVESGNSAIDKVARAKANDAFEVFTGSIIEDNLDNIRLFNSAKRQVRNPVVSTLNLLWFSDVHNYRIGLDRIIQLSDEIDAEDIICTGDIVGTYVTDSAYDGWNSVSGSENILLIPGNHDWYSNNAGTTFISFSEMTSNLYSNALNWGVTIGTNVPYWYKDYPDSKVRLIGIDSFLIYIDTNAYTTMTTWLETVLADANTNNYHVIIMNHEPVYTNNATIIDCKFSNKLNAYASTVARSPMDYEAQQQNLPLISDKVQTFIDNGGSFICYLFGHIHNDFIGKLVNHPNQMFAVIGCANPTIDDENDADRTGKGLDLVNAIVVDTATNTVKIVRFGADKTAAMAYRDAICLNYSTGTVL